MEENLRIKEIYKCYIRVGKILISIDWKIFVLLCFSTVIMGISPNISILAMQIMVNEISQPLVRINVIVVTLSVYLLIDVFQSLINNLVSYKTAKYNLKVNLELTNLILNKTKEMNLSDFENDESYDKLKRAQTQNATILFSYFTVGLEILRLFITTIFSVLIILTWNGWSVIIITIITILNSVLMLKISQKQYRMIKERTGKTRKSGYCQFLLTNDIAFKEIKAFSLHEHFISKYNVLVEQFNRQDQTILKKILKINNMQSALEFIVDILVLSAVIRDTIMKRIVIGDTITYIRCISLIRTNIAGLMSRFTSVYKDSLYVNQLFEFLDMYNIEDKGLVRITNITEIKILNLSYFYERENKPALKNVNLTLRKGDIFSVVGKNGSGKTTLLKILSGFYNNYTGTITVNGIDLRKIDIENYRSLLGIMFQDFNKYELTVRENVGLGCLKVDFDTDKIKNAMDMADVKRELIGNLDQQLGFWFKEGVQLSGGEWIKIAISRALLRDADMYILDEPNAALDPISENNIWKNMQIQLKGKIGIIITHHLRANELFNKIIVMDNGEIVDMGTHVELLDRNELYNSLYENSV